MERSTPENVRGGYIKLYRSALKDTDTLWELGQRTGDYLSFVAWLLILERTHYADEPGVVVISGKNILVERGHFLMSQESMAERLGCTRQQVRTILKRLKALGRIQPMTQPRVGLYKVCNWETYNDGPSGSNRSCNQSLTNPQPIPNPIKEHKEGREGTGTSETGVSDRCPSGVSEKHCDGVVAAWNALASKHGLPTVRRLTARRRKALQARLRDPDWRGSWAAAMAAIPKSAFLLGETGRDSWKGANFDFFVRPDTVDKILEGQYEGGRAARQPMFPDVL